VIVGNTQVRRSLLAGLIGQGVEPSLTPELHEREAQRQGLRYVYKTIDLDHDELAPAALERLLSSALRLGFDGLNVTHPAKQAMVPLVDRVTESVREIGALNTIVIESGTTVGHNTDVTGFASAMREGLPSADLRHVVLFGAGGAGTAVAHALATLGVERLDVFDPTTERLAALKCSVEGLTRGVEVHTLAAYEVPDSMRAASGMVNATPIGMAAHPGTPTDSDLLHPGLWVADIVYRPLRTVLLEQATQRGCQVLSGAGMAVHQAIDAFELITGRRAHRDAMFKDFDEMVAVEAAAPDHIATNTRATNRERNQ
jgi:shikimate dehydrogenase